MTEYQTTIGLEIHAELKTQTKMFCDCKNDADEERPNVNICPVCMAHPGTLPVINRNAVEQVLRVGTAVGAQLANYTEFDRKNYFYPDIPKNYQISQYKYPLVSGGAIGPVAITRIHLEEDTASSMHTEAYSLVDYNRAGVPLMELVTEPCIHDAETAVSFARDLRLLLIYLGASDANLEKGEMRIEANISISKDSKLGTKVEVKNLNSFKAVEQAIAFEIKRHAELLSRGEKVVQETRGWDENKQKTVAQRLKEDSHDYRYFPDPDLPKLIVSEMENLTAEHLKKTLPELPWERRERYMAEGMQADMAGTITNAPALAALYERVCDVLADQDARILGANYLTSDLLGLYNRKGATLRDMHDLNGQEFAELVVLAKEGMVSSRGAKDTLALWVEQGGSPKHIAEEHNLIQSSNADEIRKLVLVILDEHKEVVAEYKAGKETSLQFLVGQGMKLSKGSANPQLLAEELKNQIQAS